MTGSRSRCAGAPRLLSSSPRSNICTSWGKWGSKSAHLKGPKPPPFDVLRLSALNRLRKNPVLKGHGFSSAANRAESTRALHAPEKPNPEGGGGFNPRIKPKESMRALAPEECSSPIEREGRPFSAACFYPPRGCR